MIKIDNLLEGMAKIGASDLHLKVGTPPVMRVMSRETPAVRRASGNWSISSITTTGPLVNLWVSTLMARSLMSCGAPR